MSKPKCAERIKWEMSKYAEATDRSGILGDKDTVKLVKDVDAILLSLHPQKRRVILSVYAAKGVNFKEAVQAASDEHRLPPQDVWRIINAFERRLAERRGYR